LQAGSLPYGGEVARVGALTVVPVFDGFSREDPTQFYVTHPNQPTQRGDRREDWAPYADLLAPDGMLEHVLGGLVIATADRVVLVDAGVGPDQIGPYGPFDRVISGGELPRRLTDLGIAAADVTDVVFTHLHPDHYGWAVADDGRFFPNATFRCHAADWDHFVTAPGAGISALSARLLGLTDRLETWDADGPLLPGIDVRLAPGHTPGSTIVILSSGADRALLLGDVVHCPVELIDDEWGSLGDVDPALARRTKEQLARELEGSATPVAGAHFPGMRFGRLLAATGTRRWVVPA